MKKSCSLKLALALGLFTGFLIAPSLPVSAAPACDPDFMTTLQNRAWREAQREIMTNQRLILKPDSVFALSCFSNAVGAIPSTFTNGNQTDGVEGALDDYMQGNFSHGYLGGADGGVQGTNDCDTMKRLWNTSHCDNLPIGLFRSLTFANIAGNDIRINNWQTCTNTGGSWGAYNTAVTVGTGGNPGRAAGASFDTVNLFLNITDPYTQAGNACAAGIETGVIIGTSTGARYKEVVCPNPGCIPQRGGGGGGGGAAINMTCVRQP